LPTRQFTPSPTLSITPAASKPGVCGNGRVPYLPERIYASTGLTPIALAWTTTCPGPATGSAAVSSFMTDGSPNSWMRIAFI